MILAPLLGHKWYLLPLEHKCYQLLLEHKCSSLPLEQKRSVLWKKFQKADAWPCQTADRHHWLLDCLWGYRQRSAKKKQSSKCQCKCIAQEANTLTIFWEVVQNQWNIFRRTTIIKLPKCSHRNITYYITSICVFVKTNLKITWFITLLSWWLQSYNLQISLEISSIYANKVDIDNSVWI